jgi:hypothetical protein
MLGVKSFVNEPLQDEGGGPAKGAFDHYVHRRYLLRSLPTLPKLQNAPDPAIAAERAKQRDIRIAGRKLAALQRFGHKGQQLAEKRKAAPKVQKAEYGAARKLKMSQSAESRRTLVDPEAGEVEHIRKKKAAAKKRKLLAAKAKSRRAKIEEEFDNAMKERKESKLLKQKQKQKQEEDDEIRQERQENQQRRVLQQNRLQRRHARDRLLMDPQQFINDQDILPQMNTPKKRFTPKKAARTPKKGVHSAALEHEDCPKRIRITRPIMTFRPELPEANKANHRWWPEAFGTDMKHVWLYDQGFTKRVGARPNFQGGFTRLVIPGRGDLGTLINYTGARSSNTSAALFAEPGDSFEGHSLCGRKRLMLVRLDNRRGVGGGGEKGQGALILIDEEGVEELPEHDGHDGGGDSPGDSPGDNRESPGDHDGDQEVYDRDHEVYDDALSLLFGDSDTEAQEDYGKHQHQHQQQQQQQLAWPHHHPATGSKQQPSSQSRS